MPSSSDIGTRSFSLSGARISNILRDFATVESLPFTTVDIGILLSGEIFGAVVVALRGVDAGGNFSVFFSIFIVYTNDRVNNEIQGIPDHIRYNIR